MGKKGRHAAKTGDKALYKKRQVSEALSAKGRGRATAAHTDDNDNDNMYNEVERYHNRRDAQEYLKFDADPNESDEEDDGITGRDTVMDLAVGGESSSEDEEDEEEVVLQKGGESQEEDEMSADDDDDDDDDANDSDDAERDDEGESAFDWGKRKSAYYQGDTADLEIGQDVEDAFLEEEAAKEVQAARLQEMSEDDFVLSDTDGKDDDKGDEDTEKDDGKQSTTVFKSIRSKRDWSKLSKKHQRKFLETRHPELLPLTSYFSDVVQDWNDRTRVAAKALLESDEATAEAVGATLLGKEYLLTKTLLQASMALNVSMYLLLKSEQATAAASNKDSPVDVEEMSSLIQAHPVMARLQQLNSLAQKLEDRVEKKVDTLPEQLDNLAKAAVLMQSEPDADGDDDDKEESDQESEDNHESVDSDAHDDEVSSDVEDSAMIKPNGKDQKSLLPNAGETDDDDDSDNDDQNEVARNVMNEARFGLRTKEMVADTSRKRIEKKHLSKVMETDFGDEEDEVENQKQATKALSATINAIKQRAETQSRKRQRAPIEDDDQNVDDQFRRGLEMMEADLGPESGDEGGDREMGHYDDDDEGDEDGFYSHIKKKSKAKKELKKEVYKVAPKYPRLDSVVDGERAINKTILKNRGLVAHKSKINRNPRVKKREQYRKAIIRRKGAVRDIRANEGDKYGGETTGIKSNLSRSRKLVAK